MRLLLTTDTVGGVWTFTRELSGELLRRGHSVALLSFGRLPTDDQQAWTSATAAKHPGQFFFHASDAPLEWMDGNARTWEQGAAALSRFLEATAFDPHLLHSSQFCFGQFEAGVPTVVTAHSDVLSWAEACRPGGLPDDPWLRCYRRLVRGGLEGANAVAAPSRSMANDLARLYSVDHEVFVIPNSSTVPVDPAGPARRELRAVTAGRLWDPAKGLSILSEIAPPFAIEVAGDTSLDHDASTLPPLPDPCRLVGSLPHDDLLDLFRHSAVYLATSLYEPFGLAPLEAALCGCALVMRDLPSFREIWGDAALYFRNAAELQELLDVLAANPQRLTQVQPRSTARARDYTAKRMADAYLALYEDCLLNAGWLPEEYEDEPAAPASATEPQHAR